MLRPPHLKLIRIKTWRLSNSVHRIIDMKFPRRKDRPVPHIHHQHNHRERERTPVAAYFPTLNQNLNTPPRIPGGKNKEEEKRESV